MLYRLSPLSFCIRHVQCKVCKPCLYHPLKILPAVLGESPCLYKTPVPCYKDERAVQEVFVNDGKDGKNFDRRWARSGLQGLLRRAASLGPGWDPDQRDHRIHEHAGPGGGGPVPQLLCRGVRRARPDVPARGLSAVQGTAQADPRGVQAAGSAPARAPGR